MEIWEILDLVTVQQSKGERYLPFFANSDHMSMGLYVLPSGDVDPQQPHTEDEVYYALSGSAKVTVEGEERPVQPGTVIFVPAEAEHRFYDITENLMLLVVFAPPRGSQS